jgi:chaperone modulatory protein CbpM
MSGSDSSSKLHVFTVHELATRCEVELTFVEQLVEHGIIEPHARDSAQFPGEATLFPGEATLFPGEATLRVQRCLRLQRDLGVNLEGAAVILQLLDQIEALEHELQGLRRG